MIFLFHICKFPLISVMYIKIMSSPCLLRQLINKTVIKLIMLYEKMLISHYLYLFVFNYKFLFFWATSFQIYLLWIKCFFITSVFYIKIRIINVISIISVIQNLLQCLSYVTAKSESHILWKIVLTNSLSFYRPFLHSTYEILSNSGIKYFSRVLLKFLF